MDYKLIILFLAAYLIGSIPTALIIGQSFYHKDVRQYGSGNIGTTNAYRVLGPRAGTVVLVLDVLKGALAASLPLWCGYSDRHLILLIGLGAVLGHSFSIYIRFHGGKSVATSAGILLAYNPEFFLIAAAIFLLIVTVSSMVSVASTLGCILVLLLSYFYHDWVLRLIIAAVTVFVLIRHRSNFRRIFNGTENLVPFGLVYRLRQKKQK
ncbi:glycerol-3-phosphate 1-O-acyltransferase PlsY [Schleiferilactobacillus harbinensis]|uniref:glycerol-3-phosphate 1-O-acyltransferase PlsY n=1 Tax=Schleiferilactobacillus harbinensis TaxID=304207 RepID=UPI0007B7CF83|nr:glycerol-3-phosphate 1-O-acyltransferase PlsY [Schleiferilactobacillus harbinensis]